MATGSKSKHYEQMMRKDLNLNIRLEKAWQWFCKKRFNTLPLFASPGLAGIGMQSFEVSVALRVYSASSNSCKAFAQEPCQAEICDGQAAERNVVIGMFWTSQEAQHILWFQVSVQDPMVAEKGKCRQDLEHGLRLPFKIDFFGVQDMS